MISDSDRAHFLRIAEAEAVLNAESVVADAHRTPGANIEIGLALSEFAAAFGADRPHSDKVALVVRWRDRFGHRPSPA